MEQIRRFKKMGLWDFIDLMEANCYNSADKNIYLTYLDELRMRKIESISEGGNYKLSSLAKTLNEEFQKEIIKDRDFVSTEEEKDFQFIIDEICH